MSKFQPIIKWSGSKRSQCDEIVNHFPQEIDTYYEPFVGGGSVIRCLIERNVKVNRYVCSDLNQDLINLWNKIKDAPQDVAKHYENLWNELNKDEDFQRRNKYFYEVRDRFNKERNPLDFMFLMRTVVNGMPRYNSNGEFNTSFHFSRKGIEPAKLKKLVAEWSSLLNKNNVQFLCMDYREIKANANDFIYCDPPYANTKGMYFGGFDTQSFFNFLESQKCKYAFSFDGKSGEDDKTFDVPTNLFDEHLYLHSGNSSFKRVKQVDNKAEVYESLYVKKSVGNTEQIKKELNSKINERNFLLVNLAILDADIERLERQLNPKEFWYQAIGLPADELNNKNIKVTCKDGDVMFIENTAVETVDVRNSRLTLDISLSAIVIIMGKDNSSFYTDFKQQQMSIYADTVACIEIMEDATIFEQFRQVARQNQTT